MSNQFDLLGVGIGPFNLSLAALLAPLGKKKIQFLDNKPSFSWHKELMFGDALMQTNYLKDLVTAVDPTNAYSFLNYLVKHGQFYQFLNTDRQAISRIEFDHYLAWVAEQLSEYLTFNAAVESIEANKNGFKVKSAQGVYEAKNICVASGPVQNIPECAIPFISETCFHAKSPYLKDMNLEGKRVLVVGGGQTGLEIFRNALKGEWKKASHIDLITGRDNLSPLDEGPFTNEIFTPEFVSKFFSLEQASKDEFTQSLLLASDGNTPSYLQEFYNELYMQKFYTRTWPEFEIQPKRWLSSIEKSENGYRVVKDNLLSKEKEVFEYDVIILATGFRTELPKFMQGLESFINRDDKGRLIVEKNYTLSTTLSNKVYMMNFSRHGHGVADPQTSLMSWRSAVIANQVLGEDYYQTAHQHGSFLNFFSS